MPENPYELPKIIELREHYKSLQASLQKESPRAMALVYAAFLEESLEKLLRAYFAAIRRRHAVTDALFEGFGPLSSFSAKIGIAYSFSLIGETIERNLTGIRKVRNSFAHELDCNSFRDQAVQKYIAAFVLDQKAEERLIEARKNGSPAAELLRLRFLSTCEYIGGVLHSAVIVACQDMPIEAKTKMLEAIGNIGTKTD